MCRSQAARQVPALPKFCIPCLVTACWLVWIWTGLDPPPLSCGPPPALSQTLSLPAFTSPTPRSHEYCPIWSDRCWCILVLKSSECGPKMSWICDGIGGKAKSQVIVAKYGQEGAILWPRILQKFNTEKLKKVNVVLVTLFSPRVVRILN